MSDDNDNYGSNKEAALSQCMKHLLSLPVFLMFYKHVKVASRVLGLFVFFF